VWRVGPQEPSRCGGGSAAEPGWGAAECRWRQGLDPAPAPDVKFNLSSRKYLQCPIGLTGRIGPTKRGKVIEIPADIREELIRHAIDGLPNEACGLLAGRDGRVERFYPMRNADQSTETYRLDPAEQFKVFAEIEDKGWELTGIFHSHTHTEAYPSPTDRGQAFYPEAHYVLLSLADRTAPELRAYTILDGTVDEQEVKVT